MNESDNLQTYVTLMTKHQGNLRAFIVSLMPGSPDVDDVLQETNAALWQKRERFAAGTNFLAWAFKIARYEVHRGRDRARRLDRMVFSENLVNLMADEQEAEGEVRADLISSLDHCLGKLPANQAEIVRYRYTPGLSLEKLSERTGRSPGSLRISMLRIRAALKLCIENQLAARQS